MNMRYKQIIAAFFLLFSLVKSFAAPIDETTAKSVGLNFLKSKTNSTGLQSTSSLDLVYKSDFDQITCFYVFNTNTNGFVIVSGDDVVLPILGYSSESKFQTNGIPLNLKKWLEGYNEQIVYAVRNKLVQIDEIKRQWEELKSNFVQQNSFTSRVTSVSPLVQTKWGQRPYYNDLCPSDNSGAKAVTGCVATAMAQIMKYWNYPSVGSGFHSYNSNNFGTISANFGSTTYQWSSMPNQVFSTNSAVATLMFHCGVSVDMNYGINASGISTLDVVATALKTYFGYSSTVQGITRSNYSDAQWINTLKSELDAGRPIQYAGIGNGGGHSFVCDGYDPNGLFHINWGWSGQDDDYFIINSLNPGSPGTGGGTGGYNSDQAAIIGIQPPAINIGYNLALYNTVTPSSNPIYYGNAFSITTNIANNGTNTFLGDYCAAIFDDQYNFIDYVQTLSNYSLQGGYAYTNNLVFQNSGLFSMLPGTYYMGIFYRPTGGNWTIVSNSGSYNNLIPISVINSNPIKLNSTITLTPTTLVQGQSASANLNIINNGTSTFVGQYQLNLYKLDGTFVQTINTVNENNGLPPGYTYGSPYWTFTNTSISATPGTYLMAALYKSSTSTSWSLAGNGSFQNPIKVIVQAAPLQPDPYEVNNSVVQSYNLPVVFSGNTATVTTPGSNIHITTDNDYYKITLASGNNYSISARVHDSYNSGNGNTYTGDVLFSYSTDGTNWSSNYDDVMSNNISINGGGILYIHVAPYFAGNTGTYLLDLSITKVVCTTPTVSLNGSVNTCSANLVTLTSSSASGNQWYLNNSPIASATNITFTPTSSGSYTVVSSVNGCTSTPSSPVTITVTQSPSVPVISWNGSQFSTTATGVTYKWYLNGSPISGATSSTYTPTSIGIYQLQVTSSGCIRASDNFNLVVTAIDPTTIQSPYVAQVFPNPASNDFAVKFGETPETTVELQVVNNLGAVVKSVKTKSQLTNMKVSGLSSGVYYLKIIGGNYNQTKKVQIIKQK